MRVLAVLACWGLLLAPCLGGLPDPGVAVQLQLRVTNDGNHFSYSIAHPELVHAAWLEVLDRPTLLDRRPIPVEANGELQWAWDDTALNNYIEEDEDKLSISLWDPNGETLICDGLAISAHPGGVVTSATVGARGKFAPEPRVGPSEVRVAKDAPTVGFPVFGADLTPQATFKVHAEKGAWCENHFVHSEVLDLSHARITVDGQCLRRPGFLYVSPDEDKDHSAWIHVAGPKSPVLRSVSPAKLPADLPQDQLVLVLRGSGFTPQSQVYTGLLPTANTLTQSQLPLDTEYVSPTELRAHVDSGYGNDPVGRVGDTLRIWVVGSEERFELSEPRDIPIVRAPGDTTRKTSAVITSISPFPIPLMDRHSPEELRITIHGSDFVPENKVFADFGHYSPNHQELRMEYISPSLLRAWIPRQFWRKHQLRYQIVVETASGERFTHRVDRVAEND